MYLLILPMILGVMLGITSPQFAQQRSLSIKKPWLVVIAVLPQIAAFYIPIFREISAPVMPIILVGSQTALLYFIWCHWEQRGFVLMGVGLGLNLLVISLNGGLMPISYEMAQFLFPEGEWMQGQLIGTGKDIVMRQETILLGFLSDTIPVAIGSYYVVMSIGDIFIATGAFWLAYILGANSTRKELVYV